MSGTFASNHYQFNKRHSRHSVKQVSDLPSEDVIRILQTDEEVVNGINFWSDMRLSGMQRPYQLAFYDSEDKIRRAFEVKQMAGGFKFLVYRGTATEAMLDVTGLLIDYNLPPMRPKYRVTNDPNSLNYFVTLVAPQNEPFALACSALKRIFSYFDESFAQGDLNSFKSLLVAGEGAICAKTRMVTSSQRNAFEEVPIPQGVDEHGIIQGLLSSGTFLHMDDNIISFQELTPSAQHKTVEKKEVYPGCFRIGQQVEATISFRTVKVGRGNAPLIHLDNLLLLKRTGTQLLAAEVQRLQSKLVPVSPEGKIVRKHRFEVDGGEDDEETKRACFEHILGPTDEVEEFLEEDDYDFPSLKGECRGKEECREPEDEQSPAAQS